MIGCVSLALLGDVTSLGGGKVLSSPSGKSQQYLYVRGSGLLPDEPKGIINQHVSPETISGRYAGEHIVLRYPRVKTSQ